MPVVITGNNTPTAGGDAAIAMLAQVQAVKAKYPKSE